MTKVSYILTNGTTVNTLKEAQMSGQGYRMSYSPVPKPPVKLTPKQAEKRVKI